MNTEDTISNTNVKVSVRDFLFRYLRYWPLFVISLALALTIAYIYLRYAKPQYNVRATLQIKVNNNSTPAGAQEFENMFMTGGRPNVTSEIEILKSLSLAKRVAQSLGLQNRSFTKGNIKITQNYPESPLGMEIIGSNKDSISPISLNIYVHSNEEFSLGDKESDHIKFGQTITVGTNTVRVKRLIPNIADLPYREHMLQWVPLQSAAFEILGGLTVTAIKDQSNILLLAYLTPHRELGEDILNQLMVEYKTLNVEDKNETTSRTISFINERLGLITRELGDVESDLQQYKQRNQITSLELQSEKYVTEQTGVEKQLTELEVKLNLLNYLEEYISSEANKNVIVPPTLGIDEEVLQSLIAEYNALQLKRMAALETVTASHPIVRDMEAQAARLREGMMETLRNLRSTSNMQYSKLQKQNRQFNLEISSVPIKEKELLEITRQQGIKQQLYLYLLEKREETAIAQAATVSNSSVVDPAISSSAPVTPNPLNVKVLAVFLGLLLPVGFIYIRELLDDKIGSRVDITRVTSLPIFGEIGHSKGVGSLLVQKHARDVVTEQFRMIRSNLKYLVSDVETPVLLITSTFSGEGKSFVSINTGAVMALAGKRTVVLEFDIRKPKITTGLNLNRSLGVSNYLVGSDIPPSSLLVPVPEVENLFVIPCGPIPPNPSEMLLNNKLDELFSYLRANFDVVVIDTAPVGLVSDALSLSRYADCTLYVVRMGYTAKKQIHFVDEMYTKKKLPHMGLLINDIKESSHYYSYGNYGGYGYGYGFGGKKGMGYYSEETKKSSWISRLTTRLTGKG